MKVRMPMLTAAMILGVSAMYAQQNPLIGAWKLNVAKSKFAGQPLKRRVDKYEPYGADGLKYTSDEVNQEGKTRHTEYEAQFDDNRESGDVSLRYAVTSDLSPASTVYSSLPKKAFATGAIGNAFSL